LLDSLLQEIRGIEGDMLGFGIKIWSMRYDQSGNVFSFEDVHNFIFQDESFDNLVILSDTIKKISGNTEIDQFVADMLVSSDCVNNNLIKKEVKATDPSETVVKVEPELNFSDDEAIEKPKKAKPAFKSEKQNAVHTCVKCNLGFKWAKKLALHLQECNPSQLDDFVRNLKPHVKRKIVSLGLIDQDGEDLEKSKIPQGPYPQGPFFCEKCPQVFQKYPGFVSHVRAHELSHASLDDKEENEEFKAEFELQLTELRDGIIMKCEKCDLAYSTFQTYKNHMDQFHKKSLSCSDCGLKFTLKNTLVKHKIDYHSLYPKKCEQCPKILITAKEFFEHLQSHSKDFIGKTAPCEICGKLLKNKYVLKAHVESVHQKKTGEFSCDECGKMLSTKASLDYHRKSVHTLEYPYTCELCGKGFLKYNRMMTCVNNHHGIYKYRCTECEYKTNKLLNFKEHMNTHTREISYFCPVCNQQSSGTKNLGCHTKQVHKLTLCQAEILHKTSRFGAPMTEEQIEDMRHKMTSLKPSNTFAPLNTFQEQK